MQRRTTRAALYPPGYRLVARETKDHEDDRTRSRFAVDTTPPRVEIDTPAPGAVYAQG